MSILRTGILPLACATVLIITGCSAAGSGDTAPTIDAGDTPTESVEDVGGDSGEGGAGEGDASHPFPELPDGFPLPDEHMILGSFASEGNPMGHYLEVGLATDGTAEEHANFYVDALQDMYGILETAGPGSNFSGSYTVTFSGQGIGWGKVSIGENEGHMDRGDTDSSHLPVYVSVVLEENSPD